LNINLLQQNEEAELDLIKTIQKDYFFKIVKREGIDLDGVTNKKKNNNTDFHKFNMVIKNLCNKKKLTITDCAIYLISDFFDSKRALECFDGENMYDLTHELSIKYNIKLDVTMLNYLFN
jgi:hypothetical protein